MEIGGHHSCSAAMGLETSSVQTLKLTSVFGPKGMGNRHVSCVAAFSNQNAADPWHVVAWVKCVPPPAKIGLEPRGKIHRQKLGPISKRGDQYLRRILVVGAHAVLKRARHQP